MEHGALNGIKAEEEVVAVSEVKILEKRVRELERALGRVTLDNEILKEAIHIGRKKNSSRRNPWKVWKISSKGYCKSFRDSSIKLDRAAFSQAICNFSYNGRRIN